MANLPPSLTGARVLVAAALLVYPAVVRPLHGQATPAVSRVDTLLGTNQLPAAIVAIDAALAAAPRDYDVLWRASRVRLLQGDEQPAQSKTQDRLYREALALAERAIKANGAAPDGYLRRAAAAGKVALFAGVLDAADYVIQARDDAEKVLGMRGVSPLTQAGAHYILGRTHLKLAETPRPLRMPLGLGFGTLADALTHLRKAMELRPAFIMFHLDYARALAADGKPAEARPLLQAIASLAEQEPGDAQRKRDAATLLQSLR